MNNILIQSQVNLSQHTTYKVGGPAEWYIAPKTTQELQASFEWAHHEQIPLTLLGAGSNLLVSDRGLPGLVIATRHLRNTNFDIKTGQVTAGAGEPIARLAWQAARYGWSGLEWAAGIPGTVGGAVVMNAGAHDGCTENVLIKAEILSANGELQELTGEELGFSYRTSNLQIKEALLSYDKIRLVTSATFQLKTGFEPAKIKAKTSEYLKQRHTTQPYNLPSCGSVFRNPNPYKAGWLIEKSGLKGYQIGGAQVAHRHANFIVNCGSATAHDILSLIRHIQEQVHQNWSLLLEPEVRILGEF